MKKEIPHLVFKIVINIIIFKMQYIDFKFHALNSQVYLL